MKASLVQVLACNTYAYNIMQIIYQSFAFIKDHLQSTYVYTYRKYTVPDSIHQ